MTAPTDATDADRCDDCGITAPGRSNEFTLLTSRGWRPTRRVDPAGRTVVDLRCPSCHAAFRARLRELPLGVTADLPAPATPERERCIGCGEVAPPNNVGFTTLTAQGWRLTRRPEGAGRWVMDLRCPACSAAARAKVRSPDSR